MNRKLYLECYAGISGDMTVAALLDLGADENVLRKALGSLHLDGYEIEISRVKKAGLSACDFAVKLDKEHENHDHDMAYLHGTRRTQEHTHVHTDGHTHDHDHADGHTHTYDHDHADGHTHTHDHGHADEQGHTHGHDHAHHTHRGLPEILDIIRQSQMTEGAKQTAIRIFDILADAEAKAHGVPREEVHFHEVGAVDSIVDIAAAAICLDNLSVREVIVPVLYEGCGYIRCQHGVIPVPVPAVLNIASAHRLKLHQTDTEGEFVTPTGAAIAAAVRTADRLPENYTVKRIGIGAGKREYERPSLLRAMLIEEPSTEEATERDNICKLECNIDDCSGEALGFAMARLLEAGALDVHYTPVFMKKNRPAYLLTVLCRPEDRERMEEILFTETTTIGVRRQEMERTVLKREARSVNTSFGSVQVKILKLPNGAQRAVPEYESAAAIAKSKNLPFMHVYQAIEKELASVTL